MEVAIHGQHGAKIRAFDRRLGSLEGCGDSGHVLGCGLAGGEGGGAGLQDRAHLEGLFDLADVERRHNRSHPRATDHQALQRQAPQGFAHPGDPAGIARGQDFLVEHAHRR